MVAVTSTRLRLLVQYAAVFVFALVALNFFYLQSTSWSKAKGAAEQDGAVTGVDRSLDATIPIPPFIWQIFFRRPGPAKITSKFFSTEWISMAVGFTYTMMGSLAAEAFVDSNFKDRPDIAQAYHSTEHTAMRSDLLRYLLLLNRGGIYSDADTRPLVHPADWIPKEKQHEVKLIVGLEYDSTIDPPNHDTGFPVQFCQWTIAAAPGHSVLSRMVDRAVVGLEHVAKIPLKDLSSLDVINATGPYAWTEVVFEGIRERDGENIKSYHDLTGIREIRYYGDIAVLPLEGFRADGYDDWGLNWRTGHRALVRHYYNSGWRNIAMRLR